MTRPTFSPDGAAHLLRGRRAAGKPDELAKTVLVVGEARRHRPPGAPALRPRRGGGRVARRALGRLQRAAQRVRHGLAGAGAQKRSRSRSTRAALPVGKLTDEGGEWMGWADGGQTVTWIFGPDLSPARARQGAADAGAGSADAPADARQEGRQDTKDGGEGRGREEEAARVADRSRSRSRCRARGRPASVAYRGARLVTMKGDEVIERGTIVVEDNRIEAVGPRTRSRCPPARAPWTWPGARSSPGSSTSTRTCTTRRSTSSRSGRGSTWPTSPTASRPRTTRPPARRRSFGQAEMVEAGLMTGPRIFSTGFILYGADSSGRADHREPGRRAQARAPAEGAGRLHREVVHAAAARAAAVDPPGRARGGHAGGARGRRRPRDAT